MKNSGSTIVPSLRFFAAFLCVLAVFVPTISGYPLPFVAPSNVVPKPMRTIPNTDVNPYGANFFLQWEAEDWKVDKTLQMAREAGLGWVKQHFPWEDLELKKGVFWDERLNKSTWAKYDRIVALADKYHLNVIARLDRPPAWTRKDKDAQPEAPPDSVQDYADFVEAVVKHYKGKIHYYQLWNEPNIWPEWGNQPIDPVAYANLLRAGYEAVKRADPDAYVLSAPLAQTLESSARAMPDLEYLQKLYDSGFKNYFDIFFANAYGFSLPPTDLADPKVLNFQRVLLLRDIMVRNGDADKPVWFNEFGWTAPPAGFTQDKLVWGGVSEQQQAEYTVAAIEKARAEWPWAGVFCIWYFRQDGHIPSERADYYFRMVDVGFTPRPLYQAVKANTSGVNLAMAGDYQETNPALATEGEWQLQTDERASGLAFLNGSRPGDNLTINFRGTAISLLVRKGPDAGRLNLMLDGGEVGGLPRDRQGISYVDLYSPTEQWQQSILIANGLAAGDHRLRIVVSASNNPESRGSDVVVDGFSIRDDPSWPWASVLALGFAALIGLGLLLVRLKRRDAGSGGHPSESQGPAQRSEGGRG